MKIHKITYKFPELNNVLQIEWTLGNTCNYNCSYCLPILHDNSFPWINLEKSKKFIDKLHNHYTDMGITHFIWMFRGCFGDVLVMFWGCFRGVGGGGSTEETFATQNINK